MALEVGATDLQRMLRQFSRKQGPKRLWRQGWGNRSSCAKISSTFFTKKAAPGRPGVV